MNNISITDVRINAGDSAFLIDDGKTAILCDSGFAFTGTALCDKINSQIYPRKLDYIFLTHSHYDHALGAAYAKNFWPDATIVASDYAARIFAKDSAKALMRKLDREFANQCKAPDYPDCIDSLCVDISVSDGDKISAGDMTFEVVALPGHTKCSVGFYLESESFLIACETLGVYAERGLVLPSCLVGCQMTLDSIAKAKKYPVRSILVPHYGVLTGADAKAYLDDGERITKQTIADIRDLIQNGTPDDEIIEIFKKKFYTDYVKTIYPESAMRLNTSITIDLVRRELCESK